MIKMVVKMEVEFKRLVELDIGGSQSSGWHVSSFPVIFGGEFCFPCAWFISFLFKHIEIPYRDRTNCHMSHPGRNDLRFFG